MERTASPSQTSTAAAPPTRTRIVGGAVAIGLLALVLRLLAISRAPWLDEAVTLGVLDAATWHEWMRAMAREPSPPAFQVLLTLWALPGRSIPWLRLLPVVCGVGTVAAGMIWARRISRRSIAPVGILLATSPFFLRYGVELRAYGLLGLATIVTFASAWSIADADDGEERSSDRWLLMAALLLACATHFTAMLLIPSAAALIAIGSKARARSRLPLATFAIALTAWAALIVLVHAPLGQVRDNWWMPALAWGVMWRTLAEVFGLVATGDAPNAVSVAIGAGIATACFGVFVAAPRTRAWVAPLGAAVVYMGGLMAVSLIWRPVWWPRTLLPAALAATVAFGIAIGSIERRRWSRIVSASLGVVIGAWLVTWVSSHPGEGLEPWPRVASIIAEDARPAAVLAFPNFVAWPLVAARDMSRPIDLQPIGLDGREVSQALQTLPRGQGRTYLVMRLDLSLMKNRAAVDTFLAALADRLGAAHQMTVLLVLSRDVSIVPELRGVRDDVERQLTGRFGRGLIRQEGPWLSVLTYGASALGTSDR